MCADRQARFCNLEKKPSSRLVGAILIVQDDECDVQRGFYVPLETKATLSDNAVVGLPAVAI